MIILNWGAHILLCLRECPFLIGVEYHIVHQVLLSLYYPTFFLLGMQVKVHVAMSYLLVDKHLAEGGYARLVTLLECSNGLEKSEWLRGQGDDSRLWHSLLALIGLNRGKLWAVQHHDTFQGVLRVCCKVFRLRKGAWQGGPRDSTSYNQDLCLLNLFVVSTWNLRTE